MIYKIENEFFTAEIDSMGAQLHSFAAKDGTEYLWQGNPDIWYGQAPVLFPVIGQMKNDRLQWQGKEYEMPKHGLARKLPFEVKSIEASKAVFSLKSSEDTLKKYPFAFEFLMSYELTDKGIKAEHTVINLNDGEMYFSVGAHPGFNCEIGDYIEFEQAESIGTERIDSENLIIPEVYPLLDNDSKIVITEEIFKPDALILSGLKSKKLSLVSPGLGRRLSFTFGDCPFLGIWAKPGAPYVCLEPWYGVNDGHDDYGEFSNKRGIQHIAKGESFVFTWTAEPEKL